MSAVGVELTNFINPDLTWKTVTKGYRSASRRKPVVRSFNAGIKLSDVSVGNLDEMTVSDTEKNGVAVLGCRFSGKKEKSDHVPIKKRRLTAQCPQPSRTTSPRFAVVEPNSNGKRRRRTMDISLETNPSPKTSEVCDKFDGSEDFSGIEILADVACNNSMIVDPDHDEENSTIGEATHEGAGSSSSTLPLKETAASPEDTAHEEDKTEASSLQDNAVTVLQTSAGANDCGTGEGSLLSRNEMLNFDLNVTWEQPCDTMGFDSIEDDLQSCDVKPKVSQQEKPSDSVVSSNLHWNNSSAELTGLSVGTCELGGKEPKSEACPLLDETHEERVLSPTANAQEASVSDIGNGKFCHQIIDVDEYDDHPAPLHSFTIKQCSETCPLDEQIGKEVCTEIVLVDSCNVSEHHPPSSEKIGCETALSMSNDCGKNSQLSSGGNEDGKPIQITISLDTCPPIGPGWLGVESGGREVESGGGLCLPHCEDVSASSLSAENGQPVTKADDKGQANEVSAANKAEVHSPVQAGSEDLMQKSSADSTVTPCEAYGAHGNGFKRGSAKVRMEDLEDDSFESDVYQADKVHMVGTENDLDHQAGYDSQFEDGELRESDMHYYWGENGEDGEVEHLDYGSECDEERLCGLDNEKELKTERGSISGSDHAIIRSEQCGMGDSLRDDSVSPKTRASDVTTDKDFLSGMVMGSRLSNRDFSSSMEESDSIFRKDHPTPRSRADGFYNIYHRDERDASSQKFMGRDRAVPYMRGRSPGGRRFINPATGYCDSDRRYFSTYRGSFTSGPPRTKGFDSRRYMMSSEHTESEGAGFSGSDYRPRRRFFDPSPNGVYERSMRRRSPTSRDDAYRVHTGALPVRDCSPVRGGFRRFSRGAARDMREEYHRPLPENKIEYSNRFAPRLPRRERSISPPCRLQPRFPFARKKSRSRSRSHSPSFLSKERNEGSRFRSRSPDFRSDRVRLPFQKRFATDFEEGFIPARRNHFPVHRNQRWFDDRNGGLDGFRGRKSPVNMFRPSQRFDNVRAIRRFDSEDQYRPMMRSRKFYDMGGAGRGVEFDGSDDDRRKHSNRYEMVNRVRRYDTDGSLRRFRFNVEDSCAVANSEMSPDCDDGNRITDRRPGEVLRRDSEE